MNEPIPVEFTEERIPIEGIDQTVRELVELFGGEVRQERDGASEFTIPLRRGVATAGSVECTVSWIPSDQRDAVVTLLCNRDVDAPKMQRVLMLVAGVVGSVLFLLWPFFPGQKVFGTLAWMGGAVAFSVYLLTLRKSSGGIAWDFLQRLAARQRAQVAGDRTEQ